MINAKQEFINEVGSRELKCAIIELNGKISLLKESFSDKEFQDFMWNICVNYDEGWGGQELEGTIWYKDGIWSERGEYDGSEWWVYKKCPTCPIS